MPEDPSATGLQIYQKRDSGTGAFPWFCKISKNTFSYRKPAVAASILSFNRKNEMLLALLDLVKFMQALKLYSNT